MTAGEGATAGDAGWAGAIVGDMARVGLVALVVRAFLPLAGMAVGRSADGWRMGSGGVGGDEMELVRSLVVPLVLDRAVFEVVFPSSVTGIGTDGTDAQGEGSIDFATVARGREGVPHGELWMGESTVLAG